MQYEWDENKRRANIARHGVDFLIAQDFEWETAVEAIDDRIDYGEERWIAIGHINNGLYVMTYAYRPDSIRIISLRKVNKHERKSYEA